MAAKWYGMNWIARDKRLAIYIRDRFTCLCCGADLCDAAIATITLDHLRPRSKGGDNKATNLVTVCRSCNSARGAIAWRSFYSLEAQATVFNAIRRKLNMSLARAIIGGHKRNPIKLEMKQ